MKKIFLSATLVFMGLLSCSDDDSEAEVSTVPTETETEVVEAETPVVPPVVNTPEIVDRVVLNEFNTTGDWVELANISGESVDVSGYILCLGPGTYRSIGSLTIISGESTIPAGGFLVVNYELTDSSGGLGLYENGSDFTNPETLLDFVQYGASGSSREDVAVAADIWTLNDVVALPTDSSASLAYDGEGNSSRDWTIDATPTVGLDNATAEAGVVINEFNVLGDLIELANLSDEPVNVSNYILCLGPGTYRSIQSLRIISGDLNIPAGGFLVLEYDLTELSGGLGLYENNSDFTDPDTLLDFVQYGAAGSVRESVAVAAGIWTLNDFILLPANRAASLQFDGEGNSSSDWGEDSATTFGAANSNI